MGIPATGKHIVIKVAEIYKIEGRKAVEKWYFPDSLGVMTQLGVIPSIK
jgi:predicted ester cyclase